MSLLSPRFWTFLSVIVLLGLCATRESRAGELSRPEVAPLAKTLVDAALRAEIDGREEGRAVLLQRALMIAPDFDLAHWQTGEMRVGDEWLPVEEAQKRSAENWRLKEYTRRRNTTLQSNQPQFDLADWCRAHELADEERFHLLNVLRLPATLPPEKRNRQLAFARLGLQEYGGMLLTEQQIKSYEDKLRVTKAAEAKWSPQLFKIRGGLLSSDAAVRRTARDELLQVSAPDAVAAIENTLLEYSAKTALDGIEAFSRMSHYEATIMLAKHAVGSEFQVVREAAVKALRGRELHDYVPLLLDGLQSPVSTRYWVQPLPDGRVLYRHDLFREGALENYALHSTAVGVSGELIVRLAARRVMWNPDGRAIRGFVQSAGKQARKVERKIIRSNVEADERNERIIFVLSTTTGQQLDAEPQAWWKWWQEYNELYIPESKRTREYFVSMSVGNVDVKMIPSCFPAGTMVWTQTGRAAIETVQAGDHVLSQDPESGELAFKPVVGTTIRPETPLVSIGCGDEQIESTLGHPFWVDGVGWRMAKLLQVGDRIRWVGGARPIDRVERVEPAEAFNLVVAEFNTYFAGESGFLVHDNTPRRPTMAIVPGLIADR